MFFTAPRSCLHSVLRCVICTSVLATLLVGCAMQPDGKRPVSIWQSPHGTIDSEVRNPPVDDARRVASTNALAVRGLNGWEGEISGRPLPGSKFEGLLIGMRPREVAARIGAPSDYGSYLTRRDANQLRYFGSDSSRYEMFYEGSGRLIFSTRSGFGPGRYLTWIVHSLQ